MSTLGNMERLTSIREHWKDEARDFTPWLAQDASISLLAEAIGLGQDGLEVVGRPEQAVGGFRADLVCQETAPPGRTVIIENQFGTTDHDHLGKLLTYAAGKEAKILIWIAEVIREEHEAALDLLNSMSSDDFQVFGVELELYRIGESPAAPRFNVVSKPNDWTRHERFRKQSQSSPRALSSTQRVQLEYWAGVADKLNSIAAPFNPVSAQPQSWISHGIGKAGVGMNFSVNTREKWIRVEIYCSGETANAYFSMLKAQQTEIEGTLGYELDWQSLDTKQDTRICVRRDWDPMSRPDWTQQHAWLAQTAVEFHHVFHDKVRALDRDAALITG